MSIRIGTDMKSGKPLYITPADLSRHGHFVGMTGGGKTTLILSILMQLWALECLRGVRKSAYIIVTHLKQLTRDLIRYAASPFCLPQIRERFRFVQIGREGTQTTFHVLKHTSDANLFFKVGRAIDCILRGSENQDVSSQPRLYCWMFNVLYALGRLGLAVADGYHLLFPGSPWHEPIMDAMPDVLRAEFHEILSGRNGEATRILEAVRNRFKPIVECPVTHSLFSSTFNRLDIPQVRREGEIFVLDVSTGQTDELLPGNVGNAVAGMVNYEALASGLAGQTDPTYLVLDEFHRYANHDSHDLLAQARQMGFKILIGHQSVSQLKRGDLDLTGMMFQPGFRSIFPLAGEDADIFAREVASVNYDPDAIKHRTMTRRQLLKDHRIEYLCSYGESEAQARNWSKAFGTNWSEHNGQSNTSSSSDGYSHGQGQSRRDDDYIHTRNRSEGRSHTSANSHGESFGRGQGGNEQTSEGGGLTNTKTHNWSPHVFPVHEEFHEESGVQFRSFEEQMNIWAKLIRRGMTGEALVKIPSCRDYLEIKVERRVPGYLGWSQEMVEKYCPQALDAEAALLERNYADRRWFIPTDEIRREEMERLQRQLKPVIEVRTTPKQIGGRENPMA